MNQQDIIDAANTKQTLYALGRAQHRRDYEALYGVKLRRLNKRNKPIPGTDEPVEPEG